MQRPRPPRPLIYSRSSEEAFLEA
uniref:Early leader protein n=1 Tax=Simian virus 40 TaxID=1891767 RepID=Q0Z8U1_SV40|nr:early leader protein [Betapolyomavirus macacae]